LPTSIIGVGGTVLLGVDISNGKKFKTNLLQKHNLQWRTTWKLSFGVGTVSILVVTVINKRIKDTLRTPTFKSQRDVQGKHNADVIATLIRQVIFVVNFIVSTTVKKTKPKCLRAPKRAFKQT
jgi:hypothetical protein